MKKVKLSEFIAKQLAGEPEDHEVAMARQSLEAIIKNANELLEKIGMDEKDIPGWVQQHITVADENLQHANQGYHEL
jgi:hypothetical protein